jgi:LysM repeat protein
MEQPQQRSKSMVFVLVVSAILLAVATFLTILLITSRSSASENTSAIQSQLIQPSTILVNGIPVFLNIDPNKEIRLEGELNSPFIPENNQGGVPTATPIPTPAGPTATPVPPPTPTRPDPIIFKSYTVVVGDSLYTIAETQNSSVELMARYGYDANDLTPGNILPQLPVANPDYCPGSRAYVVRDNDTVYRIAAQFGITVEAIAQLNGLDPTYRIDMTQVLCIPG